MHLVSKLASNSVLLSQVVAAQRQNVNRHVPFRDSKLTFLLQDSFGGNAKTMLIANVSPSAACAQETHGTLQFADRAKCIRNRAVINAETTGNVATLKAEIERLGVRS